MMNNILKAIGVALPFALVTGCSDPANLPELDNAVVKLAEKPETQKLMADSVRCGVDFRISVRRNSKEGYDVHFGIVSIDGSSSVANDAYKSYRTCMEGRPDNAFQAELN